MPVHVAIVRHGERLDESDRQEWHRIRTQENKHDPPLTQPQGWHQSLLAGQKLAPLLQSCQARVAIYSSPTARTLTTAAGILTGAKVGDGSLPVMPVYALNCCAAAKSHGVKKAFPKGEPHSDIMRGVPLSCWPPQGSAEETDKNCGNFCEVVKAIAMKHTDGDLIVLVTHREGIWDVCRKLGLRMKSGYCEIHLLSVDASSGAFDVWDPAFESRQSRPKRYSTPPRSRPSAASPGVASAGVQSGAPVSLETLEAALAQGSGTVVLHRGGKGEGGGSTLLWRTPGVRGVWTEGGAVPDGEVLSLLSSPVTSEGDEGDFVLVGRASGIQGWTKVRNVRGCS